MEIQELDFDGGLSVSALNVSDSTLQFDKFGNKVDPKSPEAHIPYDEFIYRN